MAENPFVDRMKQLVSDSTDAKRIEHVQSVAELQEKNKQRVRTKWDWEHNYAGWLAEPLATTTPANRQLTTSNRKVPVRE